MALEIITFITLRRATKPYTGRTRKFTTVCCPPVPGMRICFRFSHSLQLAATISILAIACSTDPPAGGDMTTGGTPPPTGQTDGSTRDGATSDSSSATDTAVDRPPPPPADAAVDMSRPNDVVADTSRPMDAGVVDMNRVDVSPDMGADMGSPPVNDATPPPADTGVADTGGGIDRTAPDTAPDTGGPSGDAGCASTLTGVELFRCQALTYGRPYELVEDLVTNVGPRLAGTTAFANAVTWATAKLTALGLANVRTEPVTVPHWERGMEHAELLGPTETPLAIAALGGSVGTAAGGIEAEVIEAASVSALNALPNSQVQGKIAFVNIVMPRAMDASGYSAVSSARRSGASTAASKGAVGYIVRSLTPAMDNAPHTGGMGNASIPAVAIGVQDAIRLSNSIQAGATRVRITLGCQTLANVQTSNVIGEFVGKGAPNQILLLGAHLDSWDITPGAHDDGAGVAMVAEAARLINVYANDTRRTIRVVLYANEENGLSGANAYASAHSSELANHVMAYEADLGGDRVYGATFRAGSSATTIIRDLLAPLAPLGVATATAGGSAGADLGPLSSQGVPTAELLQDLTRYFDFHHASTDTMAALDRNQLQQATAATAVFAYQLARSDADFGRANVTLPSEDPEH
jgi:carboxypeptidase Q